MQPRDPLALSAGAAMLVVPHAALGLRLGRRAGIAEAPRDIFDFLFQTSARTRINAVAVKKGEAPCAAVTCSNYLPVRRCLPRHMSRGRNADER